MYTPANLLVNIFNKSGWVLREIQGVHGYYVIDSRYIVEYL